jgi:hypothetical protein
MIAREVKAVGSIVTGRQDATGKLRTLSQQPWSVVNRNERKLLALHPCTYQGRENSAYYPLAPVGVMLQLALKRHPGRGSITPTTCTVDPTSATTATAACARKQVP